MKKNGGNVLRKYLVKTLKITGWTLASVVLFLVTAVLLTRLPAVQNYLVGHAVEYLQAKLGTEVSIGRVYLDFPKRFVAERIYVEDQQGDTLLYAGKVSADASLISLLRKKIALSEVDLQQARAFVHRARGDTSFNYSHIIEAFKSEQENPAGPVVTDTASSPWAVSIDQVTLGGVYLSYRDQFDGNDFIGDIGSFHIDANNFLLTGSKYQVKSLDLRNSRFTFTQDSTRQQPAKPLEVAADTLLPDIGFGRIHFEQVSAELSLPGQKLRLDVGLVDVEADRIDLNAKEIDLDRLEVRNTNASYFDSRPSSSDAATEHRLLAGKARSTSELIISPWNITVSKYELVNNMLKYFNVSQPAAPTGIDFNHLWITGLHASGGDIAVSRTNARMKVNALAFDEHNGFRLTSLDLDVSLRDGELEIDRFDIATPASKVSLHGRIAFGSLRSLINADYRTMDVQLQSTVSAGDVMMFYPNLLDSLPVRLYHSDVVRLDASVEGSPTQITIRQLAAALKDSTNLQMAGAISGLPDIEKARFDISDLRLSTTKSNLVEILADSLIPSGIDLPRRMRLQGSMKGTLKTPAMKATLSSSAGTIIANGNLDLRGKGKYDMLVEAQHFEAGQVFRDKDLDDFDLKVRANGTGLTMEDVQAHVNLLVTRLKYKGYDYKELRLDGTMTKYLFSGAAIMEDENLDFTLKGDLDYEKDVPTYKLTLDLKNVDMQAIHLSERPLRARATLDVDLATPDFKTVNGRVDLRKVAVFNGVQLYAVDSLLFASIDQTGESKITIRSDIMMGDFSGTINIFGLPDAIRAHVDQYFSLSGKKAFKPSPPQLFTFDLTLKNTDLLTEVLVPELEPFTPGKIYGAFDSEAGKLDLQLKLANLRYNGISTDSISFVVDSDNDKLTYSFNVKQLAVDTLRIHDLAFSGHIAHDSIRTSFAILDSLREYKYLLGGVFKKEGTGFRFNLIPGDVFLNYSQWDVPRSNALHFSSAGLHAEDFSVSKARQKIAIVTSKTDSLVNVVFEELELGNLTRIIAGAVPASGELNGNIKFSTSNSGQFSSRLDINSMTVLQKPWGDLSFELQHSAGRYNIDTKLRGNRTKVHAQGFYEAVGDSSRIHFVTSLAPLNMEIVEPLSMGQFKNMQGIMSGDVTVDGTIPNFSIRGNLEFEEAVMTSTYLNSTFQLKNESIVFNESGMVLNNFRILDENDNAAVIKGKIVTKYYRDFELDLAINSKSFQVLNTERDRSKSYYGLLQLDLDARIKGPSTTPDIRIKAGMSDKSNVTYLIPQAESGVLDQKGIVTFVDRDAVLDSFLKEVKPLASTPGFTGVNLTATIELRGKETLNVVIDPLTGDMLSIRGTSSLTLDIDPSGNMNLSGRYEIRDGSYNLSFYKLVKRKFDIEKGSSITWSGDPLSGEMDITASNTVETTPVDLVANQVGATDEASLRPYRQRLPFLVFLNINGQLMSPEIGFRLDMPADKRNANGGIVYSRIQDINTRESDLNKQVFALLILRRFVSDNPFETQAGGGLQNTTRTSVSRLLTEQLNQLSSKIKGVQLSFDVKSYEGFSSEGQTQGRTMAQLGVSKSLFDDRLVVKLSGNVDIEGESDQSDVADYIGDLALEYKMTADGRFRITGFRNSNYDMIDGELIETGAGLIYIKDYNALRELFKDDPR